MAVITKSQLENASRDADDLALIVNGAADRANPGQANGTVTTRQGQVVRTVARVIADIAASNIGDSAAALINQRIDKIARAIIIVPDYGSRDNIASADRYNGLTVYVKSDRRWFENNTPGSLGNVGWVTPEWFVPPLVGLLVDRNRIALDARKRGMRFVATDTYPWVTYEWRLAGDPSGLFASSPALTQDDWVVVPTDLAYYAPREVQSYAERDGIPANQRFPGMLVYVVSSGPGGNKWWINLSGGAGGGVWSTPPWIVPPSAGTLAQRNTIEPDSLRRGHRYTVTEGPPSSWITYEWRLAGDPSSDTAGASVLTEPGWVALTQTVTPSGNADMVISSPIIITTNSPAWIAQTQVLVVGDSMSSPGYTTTLAASTGLAVTQVALGAQTSRKQALRVGAMPLYLTLADNVVPAAGSMGTVTLVNGMGTTYANPDAILHTAPGDPSTGYSITGTFCRAALADPSGIIPPAIVIGRATITHRPGSAANVYEIAQTGGAPIAVPPGTLFVPDWAQAMATSEVWLCVGRNDGGDYAQTKRNIAAMIAMGRGNRYIVSGVINSVSESAGTAGLAAVKALNLWLRQTYPSLYNLDAQGRDNRERIIASGNSTGQDAADRANEIMPSSLRADDVHPNATGYDIWAAGAKESRDAQAGPAIFAPGSTIAITVNGQSRQITIGDTSVSVTFADVSVASLSVEQASGVAQVIGANPDRRALVITPLSDGKLRTANGGSGYWQLYGGVTKLFSGADCPRNALFLDGQTASTKLAIQEG